MVLFTLYLFVDRKIVFGVGLVLTMILSGGVAIYILLSKWGETKKIGIKTKITTTVKTVFDKK